MNSSFENQQGQIFCEYENAQEKETSCWKYGDSNGEFLCSGKGKCPVNLRNQTSEDQR